MKSLEDEKGLLILLEVLIDAYCLYFLSKMCTTPTAISNICVSVTKIGFLKNLISVIQDVLFEKLQKWEAVAQKQCILEPILVKPISVWKAVNLSIFEL